MKIFSYVFAIIVIYVKAYELTDEELCQDMSAACHYNLR
jgi:hypothetical protein